MLSGLLRRLRMANVGEGARVAQGDNITWIEGLTPEQVRVLIEVATRNSADERLAEASRQLGLTQGAMRAMLASVGQANVSDERLVDKLTEVFEQTRKAAAATEAVQPENPVARDHVERASEAQALGARDEARRHLQAARAAAEASAQEARRVAREAEEAAGKQMLQAARAVAAEAELVLAGLDYLEAARLFGEAAALVPVPEMQQKAALLRRQGNALSQHGLERGDNAALQQATAVYRRAAGMQPRTQAPLEWAQIQNNLGNALSVLGERENGTARLEEAITAYRDALKERTRERVPLEWDMTQNNLGNAQTLLNCKSLDLI